MLYYDALIKTIKKNQQNQSDILKDILTNSISPLKNLLETNRKGLIDLMISGLPNVNKLLDHTKNKNIDAKELFFKDLASKLNLITSKSSFHENVVKNALKFDFQQIINSTLSSLKINNNEIFTMNFYDNLTKDMNIHFGLNIFDGTNISEELIENLLDNISIETSKIKSEFKEFEGTAQDRIFLENNELTKILIDDNFDLEQISIQYNLSEKLKILCNEFIVLYKKYESLINFIYFLLPFLLQYMDKDIKYQITNNTFITECRHENFDYYVSSDKSIVRINADRKSIKLCSLPIDSRLQKIEHKGNWVLVQFIHIIDGKEVINSGWIQKCNIRKIK